MWIILKSFENKYIQNLLINLFFSVAYGVTDVNEIEKIGEFLYVFNVIIITMKYVAMMTNKKKKKKIKYFRLQTYKHACS